MLVDEFVLYLEGADGSRWALHGEPSWGRDVVLAEGSLGDMYEAPVQTVFQPRVGQAGSTFLGHRILERNIIIRVAFYGAQWAEHEARFRRALSPTAESVLVMRTKLSGERRLKVRLAEAPSFADGQDPFTRGAMVKQFTLKAADPYWCEPAHWVDEFVFDGTNWTGGGVVVSNPTDVDCWPKWVVTSPARFGLPDRAWDEFGDQHRMVYLPYQPRGRDLVVDTDPLEEMIVASDKTLVWAQMNGQFFQNPIPPATLETVIPVAMDPFPMLPYRMPYEWRVWIGQKLQEWASKYGVDNVYSMSVEQIAAQIESWMKAQRPSWVPDLPVTWVGEMTASFIANLLKTAYGSPAELVGSTVQVRLDRRWLRPWG